MNLDLTGLADIAPSAAGEPLMVPLDAVDCDPDQPRQHFDEQSLQELADSILAIGVVQPISVRPNPSSPGRYIINYGERRYRAALSAGLRTIPAFVHRTPDSYTQVAENLHRADLSPMEMALFIRKRLDAGEKKAEIAARLGYKKSYVTEHLALLESPVCVEKAYANGVTSARTLYDLRRLHDEFPQQVDAWCAAGVEVTRESVATLAERVRHDEQFRSESRDVEHDPSSPVQVSPLHAIEPSRQSALEDPVEKVRHDEQPDAVPRVLPGDGTVAKHSVVRHKPANAIVTDEKTSLSQTRSHRNIDDATETARPSSRLRIRVEHNGRSATVQEDSIVHLRYEDGSAADVRLADTAVVAAVRA
ncbi:ParB/RepB/Spo0J family partition protein [Massilia sp. Root1485]|uniref:ParB/RepB/Spo0J family partition protein n=1 Tax=Massilia sp. Root1485 TaxID=1736472 RepID=UPI0006F5337D|nr:ParB/RepB/Spo0J family partition protein [Massilia sp. Root1485]KQZ34938.1 hypothetical protein ASD92_07520 [Massilia sp. Root1485]